MDKHFTLSRNPMAENCIAANLDKIKKLVRTTISEDNLRSLILLGGYGKGEGGIVQTESGLKPHNNFDLMLVTRNMNLLSRRKLEKSLSKTLNALGERLSVGIDISVMSDKQLQNMPTRVIWYDMRFGHRTIDGDDKFIPSINHRVKDIPDWDVRNLMVNRGTLMLINSLCLLEKSPDLETQKLVIKHTMKAIVGYGDAKLYFLQQYHWSYAEKRKRILAHPEISVKFKRLYDDAINFRFNPKYELYLKKNLKSWQEEVKKELAAMHLGCEQARLNDTNLSWENYLSKGFLELLREREFTLKEVIKRMFSFTRRKSGKLPESMSLKERIAYSSAAEESILPLVYPYLAFNPKIKLQRSALLTFFTSHFKQPEDAKLRHMIAAYLTRWGANFDKSLMTVIKQNRISI
jgi:hypothetical protein